MSTRMPACTFLINALGNLGNAHFAMGKFQDARECREQRLVIATEIGDRRGEASAYGNLGNLYFAARDFRKAVEYYQRQLAIAREIGDASNQANALFNMSVALGDMDDRKNAIAHARSALAIYEQIGSAVAVQVRKQLDEWHEQEQKERHAAPRQKILAKSSSGQ